MATTIHWTNNNNSSSDDHHEGGNGSSSSSGCNNESLITLPGFDHHRGDPVPDKHVFDRHRHQVVICEGLYLLHDQDGWEELSDGVFDLKIYMNSDQLDVCLDRVTIHNQCLPGYTTEEIVERTETVDRINALTVMRSKGRADVVVD
jgi:pantothenate kinase